MEEMPILEPGLHDFKLEDIGNHFLKDFPESITRERLIDGLNFFVLRLVGIGVPIELWIDGSFTTNKNDPNDIDLVFFSSVEKINNLPADKQAELLLLIDRDTIKKEFGCDVLFCPAENQNMRSYWRGWYGFDRNERPKGIARLVIEP